MIFVSAVTLVLSVPQSYGDIILPNNRNVLMAKLRNLLYFLGSSEVHVRHVKWECTRSSGNKSSATLEFPFWKVAGPVPNTKELCPILFSLWETLHLSKACLALALSCNWKRERMWKASSYLFSGPDSENAINRRDLEFPPTKIMILFVQTKYLTLLRIQLLLNRKSY